MGAGAFSSQLLLLAHLIAFTQLGVLVRVMLEEVFVIGCDGSWGPCLKGSIYFSDLVPNMFGSFLIGVGAAASTLSLAVDRPIAILGDNHPWQENYSIQIGFRTGFCGSLTTFSSWMLSLWSNALLSNKWVEAVLGTIVGLQAALVSYAFGTHLVLYVDKYWHKKSDDVLDLRSKYQSAELAAMHNRKLAKKSAMILEGSREQRLEMAEGDIPRISLNLEELEESEGDSNIVSADANGKEVERYNELVSEEGSKSGLDHREEKSIFVKTNIIAVCCAVLFTVAAGCGLAFETEHFWLRKGWLAILFGPVGSYMRYRLSFCNYKGGPKWNWLPSGTLIANLLGTAVVFGLEAALVKGNPGYWGRVVLSAAQAGFCGALTTVATFVMELTKTAEVLPDNMTAYKYGTLTILGALIIIFPVFGWVAWS